MSRLTRLELENLMRVRAVRFDPKPGMNIIRGKNEAGKSTTVNAIDFLFGGAKTHPPLPIRVGEESAQIVGETEAFTATRRWWRTADGVKTELKVVSKDGQTIARPQALFDKIFSAESDPTAFFKMKGPERLDWLKKIAGVDTAPIDFASKKLYDERTVVNRDLGQAEVRLKAMPSEKPPPAVDTAALLKEQAEATRLQKVCAEAVNARAAALRRMDDAKEAVRVSEMALQQAVNRHQISTKQAAEADNVAESAEEAAESTPATLDRIRAALTTAQAGAAANARWEERERLAGDVTRLTSLSNQQTAALDKMKADREALITKAKFPIAGLGFGEGDVTFNGLPLEQASGAQRIRIGASVLIARSPELRIMRVPDGEKLDEDNLAALEDICEEHDWQVFLEAVGEKGPATIIIRDGEVLDEMPSK